IWLLLWLVPVGALLIALGQANVFSQIALFFSKMAMVTFGGAYAVLAYVAQQAVEHYHWVSPREMLDGLGMAETTPGPLIMVLQFVGFMAAYRDPGTLSPMLAGTLGGLLATWVTFTPCFLWIFLGAPFIEIVRCRGAVAAAGGDLVYDPEKWKPVFARDKREAFARRSCSNKEDINQHLGATKERTMKRNLTLLTLVTAVAFPTLATTAEIDW